MRLVALSVSAAVMSTAFASVALSQVVRDFDPHVHAVATTSPPAIALSWQPMANASRFTISRRAGGAGGWKDVAGSLPSGAKAWADMDVQVGHAYEYKVVRTGADGSTGVGYVLAGIEVPFPDDPGAMALLVEKDALMQLGERISRLEIDLRAEGWTVIREDVDAKAKPPDVRARLQAIQAMVTPRLSAAFIVGAVPIPYAGYHNPDGHPEHRGAWPADTYYGDLDGTWTDTMALGGATTGTIEGPGDREEPLSNQPGDGKFDQDTIPSDLDIAVGRVDARDLPSLGPATGLDLVRRYLDNDHAFRTGADAVTSKTIVVDLLKVFSGDPLARMAWRDGAATFGAEPTEVGPGGSFFSALEAPGGAALAFAISYGHVDGSDAIGLSSPFRNRHARAFHLGAFGSFLGDWITRDNLLRAAIFHPGAVLGATWSNWPDNHYHQLGALWTIGATMRTSYNGELGDQQRAARGIHSGLMGDPTLRLFVTKPPSALRVASGDAAGARLEWSASPDAVVGYHVYRSSPGALGPAVRLTESPVTSTTYLDATAKPATGYSYRVVAVRLVTTGSGTFFDHSAGALATTDGPPGNDEPSRDAGPAAVDGAGGRTPSEGGASGAANEPGASGTSGMSRGGGAGGARLPKGGGEGGHGGGSDSVSEGGCSCDIGGQPPAAEDLAMLSLVLALVRARRWGRDARLLSHP